MRGRQESSPANLIVLCLNCHSEVSRKGGLGRTYSSEELAIHKNSWVSEISNRRKSVQNLDQSLALFEVKRLTYQFGALGGGLAAEDRALEIMRVIEKFARDFRYDVKELCIQFVYETASWIISRRTSDQFVSHQTSILMECVPIGAGGLRAPSPKPLTKHETRLLEHSIDVAGEIAYDVCKYVRDKDSAEQAIILLHELLLFTDLNNFTRMKNKVLEEFAQCERICKQPLRQGHAFEEGLDLVKSWKETALENAEAGRSNGSAD